jgi:hypothetical protein
MSVSPEPVGTLEVALRHAGSLLESQPGLARAAPGFSAARRNCALVLHRQPRTTESLAEIDRLLAADPRNPTRRRGRVARGPPPPS